MFDALGVVFVLAIFAGVVVAIRFIGAWLFRIDEVIVLLREIRDNSKGLWHKLDSIEQQQGPDSDEEAFRQWRDRQTG